MRTDFPETGHLPGLRSLWKEAFGDDDAFLDTFFGTAFAFDRCLCTTDDDIVVSAVYWFRCRCNGKKMAYVYALATRKSHHGRGIGVALLKETLAFLKNQGFSGVVLVPGEESLFELYRRLGFADMLPVRRFSAVAGAAPIPLRKLSKSEYAAQRRSCLPGNSVLQENENLDLLETYASFYAGPDVLLAAVQDGNALRGLEYLGSESAASGILSALQMQTGTFQSPGQDIPFAQYHSLDGTPAPGYFGFAFD